MDSTTIAPPPPTLIFTFHHLGLLVAVALSMSRVCLGIILATLDNFTFYIDLNCAPSFLNTMNLFNSILRDIAVYDFIAVIILLGIAVCWEVTRDINSPYQRYSVIGILLIINLNLNVLNSYYGFALICKDINICFTSEEGMPSYERITSSLFLTSMVLVGFVDLLAFIRRIYYCIVDRIRARKSTNYGTHLIGPVVPQLYDEIKV